MKIKRFIGRLLPDKMYILLRYRMRMKRKCNLKEPKTYNEKLQWIKLYDRNPFYTMLVDKYEVKSYVSSIIGNQYVIPLLGVWDRFDDIDFDLLPNQFVLKCTHDSGGLVICKDKKSLDLHAVKSKIETCLKTNFYYQAREWPYKNIKPRIIAEEYVEDETSGELDDYKFFCFNGQVKALFVATDRQNKDVDTKFDFFDENFNHLDIINGHPNADKPIMKPAHFEEMKALAEKLSANLPEVRVDFYEANGRVYFGEYTFFHFGGFVPFEPDKWDRIFGDWIVLPTKKS